MNNMMLKNLLEKDISQKYKTILYFYPLKVYYAINKETSEPFAIKAFAKEGLYE